ncbi:MAG TPA: efflux RND transporter periplasmic adaptor subunit [Reyranella sp.]|nr:efflux RND transporter periplasmic adaptor subunit [Reyranella sp.]
MIIMLVLVGVVLAGIFGFKLFVDGQVKAFMATMGNQPQTVSTTKAVRSDWQPKLQAVGSLRASNGADLSLQLAGVVEEINFQSGDKVEKGQLLLRLRSDDEIAKLKALEAQADLARITYERDLRQLKAQAISQQVADTDAANVKNTEALAAQQRAIVDQKMLKAPFAGRLGIRQVDLGQYLAAGTAVVTLQALTPIYVDFTLPQQAMAQLKVGQKVRARVDAYPGKTFAGDILAISPKVEVGSRNVQVRATLANDDQTLMPGMFATVDIDVGAPQQQLTLPQTAITYNAYGNIVYVVDDKGKGPDGKPSLVVRQVFVETGATRGDQVAILKGLKEGDTVVTGGQMKLRNGVPVTVNNSVLPKDDPNPLPVDQ